MIIVKALETTENWAVYHKSLGATKYIELNNEAAAGTSAVMWNDTEPTSTLFTVNTNGGVNTAGNDYVAYCFADIKGYSKFSEYTGNGNDDGPFIYTGFKPAFLIMKETTDSSTNWIMYDNKRSTFNVIDTYLKPNSSDAEATGLEFDFVSNGIKCRTNNTGINASGDNYIFMAFASEPLVANIGTGIPATAR